MSRPYSGVCYIGVLCVHPAILLMDKPLRLTFVRHLPFQGRQGRFAPRAAMSRPYGGRGMGALRHINM